MLIFYNDTVLYWSRKEQQAEKWIYLQPVTNVINCTVPTVPTVCALHCDCTLMIALCSGVDGEARGQVDY